MRNYLVKYLMCFFLILGSAGCAHEQFPKAKIDPVRKFSLGTAKFTPFKKRPTAEELYKTTLHLYDSFNTVAATIESASQEVSEWSEVDGKVEDVEVTKGKMMIEVRASKPDKEISVLREDRSDETFVNVENGRTRFNYSSSEQSYWTAKNSPIQHRPAAAWAGLLPPKGKSISAFSSMKLLSDQKINGTDVYVLELKTPAFKTRYGLSSPETRRIYIGKVDLLPRRMVSVRQGPSDEKALGLPDSIRTWKFLGFVVNSKLSNDLFPTHPPKGARLYREPSKR